MIAEVLFGEEDWVGTISGPPVIDGYDEHGFTMTVPTERGNLTIMVSQGDPCEFSADELREALERARMEREAKL